MKKPLRRFFHVGRHRTLLVWTPRGKARRIISLRKANEREQTLYRRRQG